MHTIWMVCTPFEWYAHYLNGMHTIRMVCTPFEWYAHHLNGMHTIWMVCIPFEWYAYHSKYAHHLNGMRKAEYFSSIQSCAASRPGRYRSYQNIIYLVINLFMFIQHCLGSDGYRSFHRYYMVIQTQTAAFLSISNSIQSTNHTLAWLDGAEVSASGWGSGGPRFQSNPRLTFQSCSRYQLNQLGSKAASESTFKKSNTCGVSNNRLYFYFMVRTSGLHGEYRKLSSN